MISNSVGYGVSVSGEVPPSSDEVISGTVACNKKNEMVDGEEVSPEIMAKRLWARQMRLKFSIRPKFPITSGIIDSEGYLNQE